jgi:hypothetical protein
MNIKRGGIAALICASIGASVSVLLITAFVLGNWFVSATVPVDREFDTCWLSSAWIVPGIGCAIYLGLAGFTTFAPSINYGFARTLSIIFFVAIPLTMFLGSLELTPKRVKSIKHPVLYPSELAMLIIPPVGIAFLLVVSRINNGTNDNISMKETEQRDVHQ